MGKAIGIDLGTTNSVMSMIKNDNMEVLPTSMGKDLTPSVVCYKKTKGQEKGEYIVGTAALNLANLYPENTVRSVKRMMGRLYGDDRVKQTQERMVYRIVPALDADRDKGVYIDLGDGRLSPVDISAKILAKIKEDASKALGEDVTHAVITVPAHFEERQRVATREAGEKAGFIVQRIIDEPTAAAIAYGANTAKDDGKRILVYDFGGGTLDVSLIKVLADQYVVDIIEGDNWLGGDDFDYEIIKIILNRIKSEHDIEKLKKDPRFMADLKKNAEEAKIALSGSQSVDIITNCGTSSGGEAVNLDLSISREEFENAIRPYIDRSIAEVQKALSRSGTDPDTIDEVLLVGGSTSVPSVREAVVKIFGEKKVRRNLNPMHCVAQGAARLAADSGIQCPNCKTITKNLSASACPNCGAPFTEGKAEMRQNKIAVSQATAMDLGIQVVEGDNTHAFAVIIPQGTPYPLSKPVFEPFRTFEANQKIIRIPVYEGKGKNVNDPDVNKQGEIVIDVAKEFGKSEGLPLNHAINIGFDYDTNRALTLIVDVEGTGKQVQHRLEHRDVKVDGLELDFDGPQEIGAMGAEQADEVLQEKPKISPEEEMRSYLSHEVKHLQIFLERHRTLLKPDQIAQIEGHLRLGKQLILDDPFNKGRAEILIEFIMDDINGSGIASVIENVESISNAPIKPETRNQLKLSKEALLNEHKLRGENSPQYNQIMMNLAETIEVARAQLNIGSVATTAGAGGLVKKADK